MSVAFRRESDEEHLEPKFELPIPPGPNLVTEHGLALIAARVGELEAAGGTDEAAKRDLRYWRTRLATAQVQPRFSGDEAGFGARIRYRDGDAEQEVTILGHDEADPAGGRIAYSAPLARALIGAGEGDRVEFAGRVLIVLEVMAA